MRTSPNSVVSTSAFSLPELLAVIGVIAVLSTLAVTGIRTLTTGPGVDQAANEIAQMLDLARARAIGRDTYVWVGFQQRVVAGTAETRALLVASRNGRPELSPDNLEPLSRAILLPGVRLAALSDLNVAVSGLLPTPAKDIAADLVDATGAGFTSTGDFVAQFSITFTPRGEAMLAPTPGVAEGFQRLISIGVQQVRGTAVPAKPRESLLTLDGSLGISKIYRIN